MTLAEEDVIALLLFTLTESHRTLGSRCSHPNSMLAESRDKEESFLIIQVGHKVIS